MNLTHLQHIDDVTRYQFITFRTFDSVDEFVKKISQKDMSVRKKQFELDHYLDSSSCGTYINGDCLKALYDFLLKNNKTYYELIAFALMPNHVHLLLKPTQSLPSLMQKIKGGSARMINLISERQGKFWEQDYYDRYIRDRNHFLTVFHYIKDNPLKLKNKIDLDKRFYCIYE